nr:hypothetical protein [Tanacetum cinerariifolium]
VKRCTNASGSQPRSNTKKNRISPAKGVNKLPVEEQSKTNKSLLRTSNRVDSSSRIERTVDDCQHSKESLCQQESSLRNFEDLGKLQPTADTGIFVGPASNFLKPGQISSVLVPNSVPETPYAPPTNKELEILFQPMFDEYLKPPRTERPDSPAQAEPAPVNSVDTPLSTTINQDAPTLSISPSSSALLSHSLHQGVAAKPNYMEDRTNAPIDNPPFVNVFALEPHSEASSSGDISSTESPYVKDKQENDKIGSKPDKNRKRGEAGKSQKQL